MCTYRTTSLVCVVPRDLWMLNPASSRASHKSWDAGCLDMLVVRSWSFGFIVEVIWEETVGDVPCSFLCQAPKEEHR